MAAWPIHLPAHTVYKHFSSQYVVLVWCDIVWAQVCLGQRGFLRITAVVLRTALRPYIFHVISVKGTWCFPVPNQEGSSSGTEGHIGKLSFLNDSHCCRQTKARFWVLACGRVLRSSVRRIHHLPKQGAKCLIKSVKTWYVQNRQLIQVQWPLWTVLLLLLLSNSAQGQWRKKRR